MSNSQSFGDWLRQCRRALDLTQEELARQVGCSAITLRKLEAEARRPSKQIAERLADVLHVPPHGRADFLRFARGDPFAAPGAAGAAYQPAPPRHNLPLQLTSFIGRETAMADVTQLLKTTRLVTLTGTGGTGKTRLAVQAAQGLLDTPAFPDGVWLVELAPLADPALISSAIVKALGLRARPSASLLDALLDHLRSRQLLLVLDNCEHLIETSSALANTLLSACPELTVLATSREDLHIPGERSFQVPSLSAPDAIQPVSVQSLLQFEAVQLFVDRARLALPSFALTRSNAAAVGQVCRQLDGIPLALELAAARVKVLRVEEIADRLDDRFCLLTGGSRAALPRHKTLAGLIDWSYSLLSDPERRLFWRLAVFVGGWTLPAAEAVCGDKDVLDLLTQLVSKSLVIVSHQPAGETRYHMLETIRHYALVKLETSGEAQAVRRRHAAYYVPWVEATVQSDWPLPHLEVEIENLRAVLGWSMTAADGAEVALRLARPMRAFWFGHGYWTEAQDWHLAALARADAEGIVAPLARAMAHEELGDAFAFQGQYDAAQLHMAHSLKQYQEIGDLPRSAWMVHRLGWLARDCGDGETAVQRLEESLKLYDALGDQTGRAGVLTTLAEVRVMQEDPQAAATALDEALAVTRARGDTYSVAWIFNHLGHVAQLKGEYQQAARHYGDSLANFRDHYPENMAIGWDLHGLGETALALTDSSRAATLLSEALVLFRDIADRPGISWCLSGLAGVAALSEQPQRAARLWGAAEALRQSLGARPAPAARATRERLMAEVNEQLGQAAFDAAWAEGQRLTLEQSLAEAMTNP